MPKRRKFRAIVYVDGFNLYFGMRHARLSHCRWLDVCRLSRRLLLPNNRWVGTKYFTARIAASPGDGRDDAEKQRRQALYLDALRTLPNLQLLEGKYQPKPVRCRDCGREWTDHEEKMTDVRIATELLVDAWHDSFDTAVVVSGDADLSPPVRALSAMGKRVVVAFPPKRSSHELRHAAHTTFTIKPEALEGSQLPPSVITNDGFTISRPETWA